MTKVTVLQEAVVYPTSADIVPAGEGLSMAYHATKQHVLNRGVTPNSFLHELVAWGRSAPDDIFTYNSRHDIYSHVSGTLGPYHDLRHRRAVMLEVMRVLAGFESSWNWNEGADAAAIKRAARQHKVYPPTAMEAGAWQVSADSMGLGPELRQLVLDKVGTLNATEFQRAMKQDHELAMEYIARLLRRTVNHNGPVKRHEIDPWLRNDAVTEFRSLLYPSSPTHALDDDCLPQLRFHY